MDLIRELIGRWKADYDFRTIAGSMSSAAVTLIFAICNGILGVVHASVWHGAVCVYYLVLSILYGGIIAAERKLSSVSGQEEAKDKVYLRTALLLLILNLTLIVPVSVMVLQKKPVSLTFIPAIAMAAYTTYKVTMAAVHLRKRRRSEDVLVRMLRTINFIDALVSILTLQNTLIMVFSDNEENGLLPLTAATSAAVFLAVLCLSAAAIVNGVRRIKGRK